MIAVLQNLDIGVSMNCKEDAERLYHQVNMFFLTFSQTDSDIFRSLITELSIIFMDEPNHQTKGIVLFTSLNIDMYSLLRDSNRFSVTSE